MKWVIGGAAGLFWGALWGFLNLQIMKKAIEKNSTNAVMAANLMRMAVDLAALGLVFLLRGTLPFPFEAMLIGTALALSGLTIVYAFRYGKK